MNDLIDALFLRTWWTYARDVDLPFSAAYHWFNLFEGCAWLVFAALVAARYARYRNSSMELVYAAAFLTFALTDFREAWVQQSWLIWLKAANLLALGVLRHRIVRRFYPESRVY